MRRNGNTVVCWKNSNLSFHILNLLRKYICIFYHFSILNGCKMLRFTVNLSQARQQCPHFTVNIMGGDGLVKQGASASAAMILTKISRNIPPSVTEELNIYHRKKKIKKHLKKNSSHCTYHHMVEPHGYDSI